MRSLKRSSHQDVRESRTPRARHAPEDGSIFDPSTPGMQYSTASRSTSGQMKDGGDFAEVFTLPDMSVAIGVWDASGHGETAAPNMTLVRAGWRAMLSVDDDIAPIMGALNRVLFRQVRDVTTWPFVSGFFGVVDRAHRTLRYVSCGHDAAILFRNSGAHVHLGHNSPLLGIDEASNFREDTVDLQRGDSFVIVTDGLTKARPLDSPTDFCGSRRICSLFESLHDPSDGDASWLIDQVAAYSDGWLDDDAAALIGRLT